MANGQEQSKTAPQGEVTVVNGRYPPECYLHPGSATLLFTKPAETKAIEQEHYFLAGLMEAQKQAQIDLDNVNYEALTQAGKVPERKFENDIAEAYAALNAANQAFRKELMSLTANPPEGELLDDSMKNSAIGIMELIPLNNNTAQGFKKVYVRSDKISSHIRKYKLSNVDKKTGEASFIKYTNKTITTTDADGNTVNKTIRQSKIDTQELKKQLRNVPASVKWEFVEDTNIIVTKWAEEMNKSLTWPKDEDKFDESVYHQYVDISAQAQLMRFSYGAGASAKYDPAAKKAEAKVEGHASFALGEAKAESTLFLPDRLGLSLLFPARADTPETPGGICNMGALRFAMKVVLAGNVGASIAIEVGATVDWSGEMRKGYGIKGSPATLAAPPLPGKKEVNLANSSVPDAQAGGEIGAFVGAQAGGNLSGAIEWFDPHPDDTPSENEGNHDNTVIVNKEKKFETIAELKVGITLQAGAGANAVFYITYIQGRFRIYCKAALCWGVGAKGDVGFEINGQHFLAFMKSFMYMLRNVDYQKLEKMMASDAFEALCAIPLIMAAKGVQAAEAMLNDAFNILEELKSQLYQENHRVELMNSVLSDPDQFKYSPPETKGALIAQLMDVNLIDLADPRNQNFNALTFNFWKSGPMKLRKQAIFKSLKWVQSKSDYDNVMQHISKTPGQGKGDRNNNEQAVIKFLSFGERDFFFSTNYGEKLTSLYLDLPDKVSPDAPFVSISETLMEEYLALIEHQNIDGLNENSTMNA